MGEQDNISIRDFRSTDLEAVRNLICRTIDISYPVAYSTEAIQFFKAFHSDERILDDAHEGYTVVLELDGRIVATGTLTGSHVYRVFVEPALQGLGYGKTIMRHLEEKARSSGIDAVQLDASLVSRPFYETLGYQILRNAFIEVANGKTLDFHEMERVLKKATP
jgi:GNAT superfamily N-acetyltransferase